MTTKTRPSLADRFAKKDSPPPAMPDAVVSLGPNLAPVTEPKGDKRVQVLVRMTPAERKALRRIALDQDTTVQSLVEDAIRDLLRRHAA